MRVSMGGGCLGLGQAVAVTRTMKVGMWKIAGDEGKGGETPILRVAAEEPLHAAHGGGRHAASNQMPLVHTNTYHPSWQQDC